MKLGIFSVYDMVAETYLEPFYAPSEAVAKRLFSTSVNRPDHPFHANPDDYVLFVHGEIDLSDASFSTHAPKSLGQGVEFVKKG